MKKIITSYLILFILILGFGIRNINSYAAEPVTLKAEPIEFKPVQIIQEKTIVEEIEEAEPVQTIQEEFPPEKEYPTWRKLLQKKEKN